VPDFFGANLQLHVCVLVYVRMYECVIVSVLCIYVCMCAYVFVSVCVCVMCVCIRLRCKAGRRVPCDVSNFTQILTERGVCFTLHPNGMSTLYVSS